jgi:hypothetical protein
LTEQKMLEICDVAAAGTAITVRMPICRTCADSSRPNPAWCSQRTAGLQRCALVVNRITHKAAQAEKCPRLTAGWTGDTERRHPVHSCGCGVVQSRLESAASGRVSACARLSTLHACWDSGLLDHEKSPAACRAVGSCLSDAKPSSTSYGTPTHSTQQPRSY